MPSRFVAVNLGAPLNMTEEETERVIRVVVDNMELVDGKVAMNLPKIFDELNKLYEETGSPSYLILGGISIGKIIGMNEAMHIMEVLFGLSKEELKAVFKLWNKIIEGLPKHKI